MEVNISRRVLFIRCDCLWSYYCGERYKSFSSQWFSVSEITLTPSVSGIITLCPSLRPCGCFSPKDKRWHSTKRVDLQSFPSALWRVIQHIKAISVCGRWRPVARCWHHPRLCRLSYLSIPNGTHTPWCCNPGKNDTIIQSSTMPRFII